MVVAGYSSEEGQRLNFATYVKIGAIINRTITHRVQSIRCCPLRSSKSPLTHKAEIKAWVRRSTRYQGPQRHERSHPFLTATRATVPRKESNLLRKVLDGILRTSPSCHERLHVAN
jgi:hypothetical protein